MCECKSGKPRNNWLVKNLCFCEHERSRNAPSTREAMKQEDMNRKRLINGHAKAFLAVSTRHGKQRSVNPTALPHFPVNTWVYKIALLLLIAPRTPNFCHAIIARISCYFVNEIQKVNHESCSNTANNQNNSQVLQNIQPKCPGRPFLTG
jgi:hypothetical protein